MCLAYVISLDSRVNLSLWSVRFKTLQKVE